MRTVQTFAALLASSVPCLAQPRPSAPALPCAEVARLVTTQGAVVLSTGAQTYDRYVSTRGFCPRSTYARPAYVATRDAPQCYIGFYCSSAPPLFGPFD